jgi:hypothetical protein
MENQQHVDTLQRSLGAEPITVIVCEQQEQQISHYPLLLFHRKLLLQYSSRSVATQLR